MLVDKGIGRVLAYSARSGFYNTIASKSALAHEVYSPSVDFGQYSSPRPVYSPKESIPIRCYKFTV